MKSIFLFALVILLPLLSNAQPLPLWSSSINPHYPFSPADTPSKIKMDKDGNLVVLSAMDSTSNVYFFTTKYNPNGNIIWQNQYKGVDTIGAYGNDYFIDKLNNIYVTGVSYLDSGSVNSGFTTVKYLSSGTLAWVNTNNVATNLGESGTSIVVDSSGNSYISGVTRTINTYQNEILILKIDSNGNTVWSISSNSSFGDFHRLNKIKLINNELFVVGPFKSNNVDFVKLMRLDMSGSIIYTIDHPLTGGASSFHIDDAGNFFVGGLSQYKITKFNSNGSFAWSDSLITNLPPNTFKDELRSITTDTLQNIYISGIHYGPNYNLPGYTNADIVTMKYTSSGNQIWSKRYEYQSNNTAEIVNDITIDKELNVYIAGQSYMQMFINSDFLVVKYDAIGNLSGTIRYDNFINEQDVINSILVVDSNNIYITGQSVIQGSSFPVYATTTQKYGNVIPTGGYEIKNSNLQLVSYPNPFSNTTYIKFPNSDQQEFTFQLYDYSGKNIKTEITSSDKIELSGCNLSSGLYTFNLISNNSFYNGKILKN